MKQLFTHQRLHHQGANNLLHNVFAPLRRIALLALMLCTAWGAWGQNITIKINNTTTKTGTSLENALSGVNLSTVTKLEITDGKFTETDWTNMVDGGKPKLNKLQYFIISDQVKPVANIPTTGSGDQAIAFFSNALYTSSPLIEVYIANMTNITGQTFTNCSYLTKAEFPHATIIGSMAFGDCKELRKIIIPQITDIRQNAFAQCTKLDSMIIGATPPKYNNYFPPFSGCPTPRYIKFVNSDGTELAGSNLTKAQNAYEYHNGGSQGIGLLANWLGWEWAPSFTVKYTAGPNGYLTGYDGEYRVTKGKNISTTANAEDGYEFERWSDDENIPASRQDNNVQSNIDVTAYFRVKTTKTKLIYSANSGGLVKKGVSGALASSITEEGTPGEDGPEIYPVANTGHLFLNWNDGKIDEPRSDKYDNTDITYSANFVTTGTEIVTLNYTSDNNGYIDGIKQQRIIKGNTGLEVTAEANDPTNYEFLRWTDGKFNNPRQDANVTKNIDVTAQFVPSGTTTYDIKYIVNNSNWGHIKGENEQKVANFDGYRCGNEVEAEILGNNIFLHWNDGDINPKRTDCVNEHTTFTAEFVAAGTQVWNLTYGVKDNIGGQINGKVEQRVANNGNGHFVTASTDANYNFLRWSDGSTINPRQDTAVKRDINVTAQFIHQDNVADVCTLTYNSGTNGTINGYTPQHLIKGENGSPVTAVAKPGYKFVRWSDGRFDNPRTDTNVQDNITVTAEYTTETTKIYTLTYSADANGSITGPNPQQVAEGGDAFAVRAEPIDANNYTFYRWSDGCSENPRTDKKVTENIIATAEFIPASEATNIYKLKYVSEDDNKGTIYKGFAEQNVLYPDGCGVEVKFAGLGSYKFFRWNDFNADSTRKDCNLTSNPTEFTAYFIDRTTTTYELKYSALDGGYISGPAWQRVTTGEDGSEVEAKPEDGYIFVRWSDGDTIAKRQDMNVTDDITVTAEFVPVGTPIYYVEYIAGTGGKIEPASLAKQKVPAGGNTVEIEAKGNPETDFMFTGWSDNLKTSKRSDKVTANAIYTANFTPTCCKTHWHYDTTKIAQNPCGEYTFQFPWGDTRDTVITDSETYTFTVRKDIGTGTCSAGSGIECDSLYILRVKFLPSTEHYFHVLVDDEFKYKGKTYTCNTANDTILYIFDDEYDISNCDTLKIYVHFNHPKPLSTSNVAAERINLYPNPTNTGFYIEAEAREVTVSSINGQLLHRQAISGKTYVDISHLPAGVYMVRAGSAVAKVVRI